MQTAAAAAFLQFGSCSPGGAVDGERLHRRSGEFRRKQDRSGGAGDGAASAGGELKN